MPRVRHGGSILLHPQIDALGNFIGFLGHDDPFPCPEKTQFGFLFPNAQLDKKNLLPDLPTTAKNLIDLGLTMADPNPMDPAFDSKIPSIYTYFGQFITHDITLEGVTSSKVLSSNSAPLTNAEIAALLNTRTGKLDLDSVYGPTILSKGCRPVPMNGEELKVSRAFKGKEDGTDLPRELDDEGSALIGDPRNDENIITSQLHLAFIRAHNALVRNNQFTFAQAQTALRHHYQWIVANEFLDRIADPNIVAELRDGGRKIYEQVKGNLYMPLEFSSAAFRFGHTMIRETYRYNSDFKNAHLLQLFMPEALGGYFQILPEWIIDWSNFVQGGSNVARLIDTRLVEPLSFIHDANGKPTVRLAIFDLLRGYLLRLPTGQAVAEELKLKPEQRLTDVQLLEVAANDAQRKVLKDALFLERTPLWFYVVAEAAHFHGGERLGPVGSYIVAGTLIGLLKESPDSYMNDANWKGPTLGNNNTFTLDDLLRLAGVLT